MTLENNYAFLQRLCKSYSYLLLCRPNTNPFIIRSLTKAERGREWTRERERENCEEVTGDERMKMEGGGAPDSTSTAAARKCPFGRGTARQ